MTDEEKWMMSQPNFDQREARLEHVHVTFAFPSKSQLFEKYDK